MGLWQHPRHPCYPGRSVGWHRRGCPGRACRGREGGTSRGDIASSDRASSCLWAAGDTAQRHPTQHTPHFQLRGCQGVSSVCGAWSLGQTGPVRGTQTPPIIPAASGSPPWGSPGPLSHIPTTAGCDGGHAEGVQAQPGISLAWMADGSCISVSSFMI